MQSDFIRVENRGAEKTVIVFSSVHTTPGRFRFDRLMDKVDSNIIFLNCPNNEWYLHGVPGLGVDLQGTRKALSQLLKCQFSDTKIYAFGSSMGASGMIALTAGLDIERSLAFCPEIDLFGIGSFSKNYYKGPGSNKTDIWSELNDCKNLNIFYGEECELDLLQLSKLKKTINIPLKTFAHEAHGTIEAIYLTEGMNGIFETLFNGAQLIPKVIDRGHISGSLRTCDILGRAYLATKSVDSNILDTLKKLLAVTAEDRSYYSLICYWIARHSSEKEEKTKYLLESLKSTPYSLRSAHMYFKYNNNDNEKEIFKNTFLNKYGEKYANHSRCIKFQDI